MLSRVVNEMFWLPREPDSAMLSLVYRWSCGMLELSAENVHEHSFMWQLADHMPFGRGESET